MIWRDHLLTIIEKYEYFYKKKHTYLMQEFDNPRFKDTEFSTLNFEDGSRIMILNTDNLKDQEQAFDTSMGFWYK